MADSIANNCVERHKIPCANEATYVFAGVRGMQLINVRGHLFVDYSSQSSVTQAGVIHIIKLSLHFTEAKGWPVTLSNYKRLFAYKVEM